MGLSSYSTKRIRGVSDGPTRWQVVCLIGVAALMALLRCYALESDAYPHLSWSSALLTDEGFYIHNARNQVLFGHAQTDQFNNMMIMPTLHWLQVLVFHRFGVGAVQARSISVVLGLAALPVLFVALRRTYDLSVACIGTVALGLGHANLMYSRMALMDTPAAFGMVCVFLVWTEGVRKQEDGDRSALSIFGLSGLLLAGCYVTRGLSAWLVPIGPIVVFWRARQCQNSQARTGWYRCIVAMLTGLLIGLIIYIVTWYGPHRAELTRMTHYYLLTQLLPHSLGALKGNIVRALFGDFRGIFHYLFSHSPVELAICLAVLAVLVANRIEKRSSPELIFQSGSYQNNPTANMAGWFLIGWLLVAWLTYSVASYAPDRYYVLFYPAMAAITAIGLSHLEYLKRRLDRTWTLTVLAAFLAFHFGEALLHHQIDWLVAAMVIATVCMVAPFSHLGHESLKRVLSPTLFMGLWVLVNAGWTADWLTNLSYLRRDTDRWLARSLPANSVLIGDVAPGLCLDNRFLTINVIPGLCNYDRPLEQFSGRPQYVAILDQRMSERYWRKQYPDLLSMERRIALFPNMLNRPVGIFRVDLAPGPLSAIPPPGQGLQSRQ